MRAEVQHPTYGSIVYEESLVGRRELSIGGVSLRRISSTDFEYLAPGEPPTAVRLRGSYLSGVSLNMNGEEIPVVVKMQWYEVVLSVLIFAAVMVWSSVPSLIRILPVVGGMVGGAISGVITVVNLILIKSLHAVWLKVMVTAGMILAALAVCGLVGWLILLFLV